MQWLHLSKGWSCPLLVPWLRAHASVCRGQLRGAVLEPEWITLGRWQLFRRQWPGEGPAHLPRNRVFILVPCGLHSPSASSALEIALVSLHSFTIPEFIIWSRNIANYTGENLVFLNLSSPRENILNIFRACAAGYNSYQHILLIYFHIYHYNYLSL